MGTHFLIYLGNWSSNIALRWSLSCRCFAASPRRLHCVSAPAGFTLRPGLGELYRFQNKLALFSIIIKIVYEPFSFVFFEISSTLCIKVVTFESA